MDTYELLANISFLTRQQSSKSLIFLLWVTALSQKLKSNIGLAELTNLSWAGVDGPAPVDCPKVGDGPTVVAAWPWSISKWGYNSMQPSSVAQQFYILSQIFVLFLQLKSKSKQKR